MLMDIASSAVGEERRGDSDKVPQQKESISKSSHICNLFREQNHVPDNNVSTPNQMYLYLQNPLRFEILLDTVHKKY